MGLPSISALFLAFQILLVVIPSCGVYAVPKPEARQASSNYWVSQINRQGTVAYGTAGYKVYRNVKDYGAKGDGTTDDTAAINRAITDGNRCGQGCDSSTTTPALVYFPPGTYIVSAPIIQYYYTQFVGDAITLPTIKAAAGFQGIAIIDSDPYADGGINWYTNQNNFFRQVRNFVIDLTAMPQSQGAGIHWQVAQATSLQNIRFEMVRGGGQANKQSGIFMDNGSGGILSDLVFNGGNYGAFLGNQQFTTRNLFFNGCNTAIYMNWNWAWTLKSISVNDCAVGIDMANVPDNQTVGSVLLLDSKISSPIGIKTAFTTNSVPRTGGTLIIDNVDFTSSQVAVANSNGGQILAGGSVVQSWGQGEAYTPNAASKRSSIPAPELIDEDEECDEPTISDVLASSPVMHYSSPSASGFGSQPSTYNHGVFSNSTISNITQACSAGASAPVSQKRIQGALTAPSKPAILLNGNKVFEKTKPQYETVPASSFVSVKSGGAKGDGVTDDTAAIQKVLDSATSDQIVYFDHGAYVITSTVKVPKNIKITGEIWPLIMASGSSFSDQQNPKPVFQVGQPGDVGSVEISDLIFETLGPAPGAILTEWNVAQASQGSAGMWDVHYRIGGSAGTKLQSDTCSKNPQVTAPYNPACVGAFLLLHVTPSGSGYFENNWFWVADHELDQVHNQINIYNGRGVLIESQAGPVWLYGTSSEHSQLYNYQLSNSKNTYMALIQTETAYMQSNPDALGGGFTPQTKFNDPTFADCTTASCKKTWGLRIVNSQASLIFGAGLYSFFENYDQTCLDTESCQDNMVDIQCSSDVHLYALSTKASVNMVTRDGVSQVKGLDNDDNFCQTIALFEAL